MKLISLSETVDFLSQAAPRPWVHRLLRWMLFDQEIEAHADGLKVQPYTNVFTFTVGLHSTVKEFSGPKMDAAIREEYSAEFAKRLVGKEHSDRVDDEPSFWSSLDEIGTIDPGFFMYATEIDWNMGTLKAEWIPGDNSKPEMLFPTEEWYVSEFENADYEFEFSGIKLEARKIELLLPNIEMKAPAFSVSESRDPGRSIGRPPKWNWEGAMAHIVSVAQHPDGLPEGDGAQARIEDMIANWFISETGNSPAVSQIRKRAASIMGSIKKDDK